MSTPKKIVAYMIDNNVSVYDLSSIPDTFQGVAEMVLDRLPKGSRVYCVTDTSKENSIKFFVNKRRGTLEQFCHQAKIRIHQRACKV